MDQAEARKLWLEAVERIKDRTLAPTLWRALEAGVGIISEGDQFVVGVPPSEGPMAGYITSAEYRTIVENVLSELIGSPTRVKVIDGVSMADYESVKQRELVAEQTRRLVQDRKRVERAAERQWETIMEQCSRKYANTPLRQLPQMRGQYLFEALKIISDAMDEIHPDGKIDEIGHRALARVIEKVATLADVPGATVAVEFIRYRSAKARQQG